MLILAFETSGPTASAALMSDGVLIGEQSLHHTRTHSEVAVPMAENLLNALELTPRDLDALCVNCGPGSFTGLRIGVASANAMAQALDIPVVGVDSLSVLYENAALYQGPVCCMLDARNESVYAAQFINGSMQGELYAGELRALLPLVPDNTLFIGDGALAYGELILSKAGHALIAPERFALCRAGALCAIAHKRFIDNAALKAVRKVEPIYLRPSQAERMWRIKHGAE